MWFPENRQRDSPLLTCPNSEKTFLKRPSLTESGSPVNYFLTRKTETYEYRNIVQKIWGIKSEIPFTKSDEIGVDSLVPSSEISPAEATQLMVRRGEQGLLRAVWSDEIKGYLGVSVLGRITVLGFWDSPTR